MHDAEYCSDPKQVHIFEGVREALCRLKRKGYKLIIITNQSGIGRGFFTLEQYRARYEAYRSDPDLQFAHAAAPWVVTWDDHDVDNNYAGLIPEERDRQNETPEAFVQDWLSLWLNDYVVNGDTVLARPAMFAQVSQGQMSAADSVHSTSKQVNQIFAKWRKRGKI